MALFNIDDKPQPSVGKHDYWLLFRRFRGTALHSEIVNEIIDYLELNKDFLDSQHLGSDILKKIEKTNPVLYKQEPPDEMGSLFGMTLWNVLADDKDDWKFLSKSIDSKDGITGTQYFK
jgi:hypothetical protein